MILMTIVFSGMLYSTCLANLDDIIIFGATFEEHLNRLEHPIKRLKTANLKLKRSKCAFGKKSVSFLGHIINEKGISTNPEKLKRIQVAAPSNTKRRAKFTWVCNVLLKVH